MINQLIQVITREAALFEEFLKLLEIQRKAVDIQDVEQLSWISKKQQESLTESKRQSDQREQILSTLKRDRSLDGDINVARLAELANDDQAVRLLHLREIILDLEQDFETARQNNAAMLSRSEEFISQAINLLSQINHPNNMQTSAPSVQVGGG